MHKHAIDGVATKARRQDLIRSFVRRAPLRSQIDVVRRLRSAGVRVTQSTLSRDLRDLGLVKSPAGYRDAADVAARGDGASGLDGLRRLLRSHLADVAVAANLVVLRTSPGMAHALGVALDRAALDGIVGTVAGDDTLFAATPHPSGARSVERRLRGLIGRR
jgi:transcriptional regulator of arginine metabolism